MIGYTQAENINLILNIILNSKGITNKIVKQFREFGYVKCIRRRIFPLIKTLN